MTKTLHFKAADMKFDAFGGPPGKASIARLIGEGESKTMGAGVAIFDGCSIEWTVLYDEAVVVLEQGSDLAPERVGPEGIRQRVHEPMRPARAVKKIPLGLSTGRLPIGVMVAVS